MSIWEDPYVSCSMIYDLLLKKERNNEMVSAAETRAIEQGAYERLLITIREILNTDYGEWQDIFRDAMNSHDFIGGFTFGEILKTLSPNEIMDAYDKWKLTSKFSVGDQVTVPDPPSYKNYKLGYVTKVKDGVINIIFADGRQAICTANEVTKTGKCVKNIPDLLTFLRTLS